MEFSDLLKERHSIRKFKKDKVEQEKLDKILEAGKTSPTSVNYQPQVVLVLDSEESLLKLKECTPFHFYAPLALIVCYDKNISWKRSFDNKEMGEVDASIVTTHMMLEVTNLGLGTTWVGHFDPEKLIKAFSIPDNLVPVAILPIGYASDESKPHPYHYTRKPVSETTYYNTFDR